MRPDSETERGVFSLRQRLGGSRDTYPARLDRIGDTAREDAVGPIASEKRGPMPARASDSRTAR